MASRPSTVLNNLSSTQNSAPVLEYRCLFTSDLRRKQKRWQDGRVKFHTFNKRIMVYDDRGNVVGDAHWRQEHNFGEGEELELEMSGKLVQVTEFEGDRDQDLTELLEKRLKEREERVAQREERVAANSSNSLIGTPYQLPKQTRGAVIQIPGQAHPFTERSQQKPSKRRKPNGDSCKNGYAQCLMGTTHPLCAKASPSEARMSRLPKHTGAIGLGGARTIWNKESQANATMESQTSTNAAQVPSRPPSSMDPGFISTNGGIDKIVGRLDYGKPKHDNASKESQNSRHTVTPSATTEAVARLQQPLVVDSYTSKTQERLRQSKSLRIKSRPKTKLLFMDKPDLRSLTSLVSGRKSCEPTVITAIQPQNMRPILSQSKEQLDSFRSAQEQRSVAHFNRKHSMVVQEPLESLNPSLNSDKSALAPEKEAYVGDDPLPANDDDPFVLVANTTDDSSAIDTIISPKYLTNSSDTRLGTRGAESQVTDVNNNFVEGPDTGSKKLRLVRNTSGERPLSPNEGIRTSNINGLHTLEKISPAKPLPAANAIKETAEATLINKPNLLINIFNKDFLPIPASIISDSVTDSNGRLKGLAATQATLKRNVTQMVNINTEASDIPKPACASKGVLCSDTGSDKGPWSREAFDLFDWNPGSEAKSNAER